MLRPKRALSDPSDASSSSSSAAVSQVKKRRGNSHSSSAAHLESSMPRDPLDDMLRTLEDGRAGSDTRNMIMRQFWVLQAPYAVDAGHNYHHLRQDGEQVDTLKFSPRYHSLDASKKLRLLEVSGRDEIARDLLNNQFQLLDPILQVELLRISPLYQMDISKHILSSSFDDMDHLLRMRFIEIAPRRTLFKLLNGDGSKNALSINETLTIALLLRDKQYTDTRDRAAELVWRERARCSAQELMKLCELALPRRGNEMVKELVARIRSGEEVVVSDSADLVLDASGEARGVDTSTSVHSCIQLPNCSVCGASVKKSLAKNVSSADHDEPDDDDIAPAVTTVDTGNVGVVFPKDMAECFEELPMGRRLLGCGPMIAMPRLASQVWRIHFRELAWSETPAGYVQVVLLKEIGHGNEALIMILLEGVHPGIPLGVVDDESPCLEIPLPLPGIGHPDAFALEAHIRPVDESDDLSAVPDVFAGVDNASLDLADDSMREAGALGEMANAPTAVASGHSASSISPVLETTPGPLPQQFAVVIALLPQSNANARIQFREFGIQKDETFASLLLRSCHSMGLGTGVSGSGFMLRDTNSRECMPSALIQSPDNPFPRRNLVFFLDQAADWR